MATHLSEHGVDAMVVLSPEHVYYLTGYLPAVHHAAVVVVTSAGQSLIVLPNCTDPPEGAVDAARHYDAEYLSTTVDDPMAAALSVVRDGLRRTSRLASDMQAATLFRSDAVVDLSTVLLRMRRSKYPDEIELIKAAVRACEAAYARAAQILAPGVREIDIYAEMLAAATKQAGLPLGDMGYDFQAGTTGGPPRMRAIERGELIPLDVSVVYRGYRCDLCRTFAVDRQPTAKQQLAVDRVLSALEYVEQEAREGVRCRDLFTAVKAELEEGHDWEFPHHLGHGFGLKPHEAPRLNPHWDDVLQVGDVFTVQPGLYHPDLNGGVRIEHNYWLTPERLVRLSSFPTSLVPEVTR
ncbi:M24 family metallopeptidase [Aeoliella mucimassa]|uniref:M24 family metallopeptidase n=1 Tax=Aeoliella mucimassa TaxID=2527972 RepID=UPI001E3D7841|nr:M24 family peptidase [Aeoliella mucimassa]